MSGCLNLGLILGSGTIFDMLTLGIDTHDAKVVKVALKDESGSFGTLSEENQFGSQVLLKLIQKLLKSKKKNWQDLTAIEVHLGPGSFTGLRVGAAVANGLGYSLGIPVNGKMIETDLVYS